MTAQPTTALATVTPISIEAGAWELLQRRATALSKSGFVPKEYQNNIPNCIVALQLADRTGSDPLMLVQNLDVIHGRPSLRATFLIACVNQCGRFSALRYRWQGTEGADDRGCRAVAVDLKTGEECVGALITIAMAKAEGWYQKNGSKWKTMGEQMSMYRAAAFWSRAYAPEMALGMQTSDEVIDVYGETVPSLGITRGETKALEAELLGKPSPAASTPAAETDPLTGEIIPDGVGIPAGDA